MRLVVALKAGLSRLKYDPKKAFRSSLRVGSHVTTDEDALKSQKWYLSFIHNCITLRKILHFTNGSEQKQPLEMFYKTVAHKKFLKFPENMCVRVSFLIKLQASQPATLLIKILWHRCFPMNFAKFLRVPFLKKF